MPKLKIKGKIKHFSYDKKGVAMYEKAKASTKARKKKKKGYDFEAAERKLGVVY